MSALRPLPPRPSLAFERKEAKALLRRLRAADPEAVARARACHPTIEPTQPDRVRLADAQLVIAREYGFASWPRLVRYFGDLERQVHAHQSTHSSEVYESVARSLIAEHGQRRGVAGRAFAAYVPRFYGESLDEVFAAEVTEAEARLATARMYGFPSWEMLRQRAAAASSGRPSELQVDPIRAAIQAIAAADLDALRRVVEAYPELLDPTDEDEAVGRTLLSITIRKGQKLGVAAVRPMMEWLAAQGLDLQRALNLELCVPKEMMQPERVRYLLDCGADPSWVAPSGIPVLEHALLRWFNGDAVDVLAARATPRRALWIAAGLGDIDGVRRFLDAKGRPTRAARRLRPDFVAVGRSGMTFHPDPDDEEILLEAFVVAIFNGRTAVLEYMVGQGFDVNTRLWDTPVLNLAVGGEWTPVVECLLRLGADPDLEGWKPNMSAREIARELFEQNPEIAERRRIVELCGMDPDGILAERDARPVAPPVLGPDLQEALELAGDDALRLGLTQIGPENLLFGLLRADGPPRHLFTLSSRMDLDGFRAEVADRLRPAEDRLERPPLPMDPDARAAMEAAIAIATERRRDRVTGVHLLWALTRDGRGPVAELLISYGSSAATLNAQVKRAM